MLPYDIPHMNLRRIAWLGVTSIAVASWFSAASTPELRTPSLVERASSTRDLDRSAAAMQSEVARLHDRIAPTATPSHARDLFRFVGRAPRPVTGASQQPAAQAAEVPVETPARPTLQLIGVAEDESADGIVRTAIVSGLGDLFLVKPGDIVAGQYLVERVTSDAVQLTDTSTSASTTLTLH